MPSGEHMLIWDNYNTEIVRHWWYRHTPEELQGIINLRQWQLERRNFAHLGGVLRRAIEFNIVTEEDAEAYKKQHNKLRAKEKAKGLALSPDWGIDINTSLPVSETIGMCVSETEVETGNSTYGYRIVYPSERATWHELTPEELEQMTKGVTYATV